MAFPPLRGYKCALKLGVGFLRAQMDDIEERNSKLLKQAINQFQSSLNNIEPKSPDALALIIFINGCFDTGSFASNKYQALVHYQKARSSANHLGKLLCDKDVDLFKRAIRMAQGCLISSGIANPELCMQS